MGVKNAFLGRLLASSDKFSDEQVAQTINLLVEHGVRHGATDIHIEPHERFGQVRYRIDNVLRSTHKLPLAALPAIAAQLKDLANLKSNGDALPQEGQYATLVGEDQFEVQVYTMPVIGGEKIVLHLASRLGEAPSLEALGFWGSGLAALQQTLTRSHGLIILATPRRQGKTTTLHSLLRSLNTPTISIATIEPRIEYRLPGSSQTEVRPAHGIRTHDALKAALNQDPNIIMVGSITDRQTASASVEAANGGHMVIGGIHADSAVYGLAQLQALNEESFLLAHAAKLAISQRLVRRLCPECRQSYQPGREENASLQQLFGLTSPASRAKLHELEKAAIGAGIGGKVLATLPGTIATLWQANDDGCEHCNHTGFRGSVAITEVLEITPTLQNLLLKSETPANLQKSALKEGFIPIEIDGLIKALRGQTTIAEILRVLPLS